MNSRSQKLSMTTTHAASTVCTSAKWTPKYNKL
uniref:Uncharacterized protein n=1 Tax=Moniliophthora roreri TaxID=221103 RepID=A0A0W0EU43_MONRR